MPPGSRGLREASGVLQGLQAGRAVNWSSTRPSFVARPSSQILTLYLPWGNETVRWMDGQPLSSISSLSPRAKRYVQYCLARTDDIQLTLDWLTKKRRTRSLSSPKDRYSLLERYGDRIAADATSRMILRLIGAIPYPRFRGRRIPVELIEMSTRKNPWH